ncbi:MAG: hypothetical protein ABI921_00065 [Panacibacter sp.]
MSNIFRKPVVSEEKKNKYERLGFKHNPFPVDPAVKPYSKDERENGSIYMTDLREEEIQQFNDIVINSESKINLLMDYAAYRGRGIGKTAFLNYLRKEINKDLGDSFTKGQQVLYAIYVNPGGEKKERKFSHLSRIIYESIMNDELLLITFCRLRAGSGLISNDLLNSVTYNNLSSTLGNDNWLTENKIDLQQVDYQVEKKLVENGVTFFKGTELSLFDRSFINFKKIFSVENTELYWKNYGVDFVFSELVKLFKAADFSNIILLFDEAEKIIISQNFGERREFCDNLRYYFIDGSNENAINCFYKLLMTIHPNSQELLLTHWNAAGLDRFSVLGGEGANANTIFFRPLKDKKLAVLLAKEYLTRSRIETVDLNDELLPFEEEALEKAIEICDGIPGKFLKLLYNAIEQSLSEGWDKITSLRIDNIWRKIIEIDSKPTIANSEMLQTKTNLK